MFSICLLSSIFCIFIFLLAVGSYWKAHVNMCINNCDDTQVYQWKTVILNDLRVSFTLKTLEP